MPQVIEGEITDFRRAGALVEVELRKDNGELVKFVTGPVQFRGMLDAENREVFDAWWGETPRAS